MKTNEVQAILSTVKTMLKNRSTNYSEFAVLMGMSESGVKKMLNGDDCSMSRLIQMSNVLCVPLLLRAWLPPGICANCCLPRKTMTVQLNG